MGRGWDILHWLGVEPQAGEPDVLDAVSAALDPLDEPRGRYVAAFAYLLGRVAAVDRDVTDAERRLMARLVAMEGDLSAGEAATVVALALGEVRRFGGTHNLHVTREFARLSTPAQRMGLVRCLFAVSAVDRHVETQEDNEIRRITRELKIEHADFIRARAEVREHLAVLKNAGASSP
jgi:uncharacterized tellurite resistance protein B-like protein